MAFGKLGQAIKRDRQRVRAKNKRYKEKYGTANPDLYQRFTTNFMDSLKAKATAQIKDIKNKTKSLMTHVRKNKKTIFKAGKNVAKSIAIKKIKNL